MITITGKQVDEEDNKRNEHYSVVTNASNTRSLANIRRNTPPIRTIKRHEPCQMWHTGICSAKLNHRRWLDAQDSRRENSANRGGRKTWKSSLSHERIRRVNLISGRSIPHFQITGLLREECGYGRTFSLWYKQNGPLTTYLRQWFMKEITRSAPQHQSNAIKYWKAHSMGRTSCTTASLQRHCQPASGIQHCFSKYSMLMYRWFTRFNEARTSPPPTL